MMKRKRSWFHRTLGPGMALSLVIVLGFMASCTNKNNTESNERLREQAAHATETAKQRSQEALAEARAAAAEAAQRANAIATGVKQGINDRSANQLSRVNINTASISELESLPGVSASAARQIVEHRPYNDAHQLVDRGLLTKEQYDKDLTRITVR